MWGRPVPAPVVRKRDTLTEKEKEWHLLLDLSGDDVELPHALQVGPRSPESLVSVSSEVS